MWVWVRMPFYHPRMCGYDVEYLPVETDQQWVEATEGREWDLVTWVERTSIFLAAKLLSGEPELEAQGAHGFWELATNRAYDRFFTAELVTHILNATRSHHAETVAYATATVWMLSKSEKLRALLTRLGGVECLLEAACWAFNVPADWDAHQLELDVAAGTRKRPPPPKKKPQLLTCQTLGAASRCASPFLERSSSLAGAALALMPGSPQAPSQPRLLSSQTLLPFQRNASLPERAASPASPGPEPSPPPAPRAPCSLPREQLQQLQANALGALAVMACDAQVIAALNLNTLLRCVS
jgi:hypothetical protein